MTTLDALTAGFRSTNRSFGMIVLLYAFNFLFAAILAWGVHSVLSSALGDSMSVEKLVKDFDYSVFADYGVKNSGKISGITSEIAILIAFYLLLNTLLGGGTIAILQNVEERFSMRSFFGDCGAFFFRFFRLFLIFGIILLLVVIVMSAILGGLHSALTANAVSEVFPITLGIILLAVFLFSVMIIVLIADYAKVATVRENAKSMFKTSWQAIKFVFHNFFATVGMQLSILVLLLIGVSIYLLLENQIGMPSALAVIVMFFIQQGSVMFKVWTRVLTFASELELFERLEMQKPLVEAVALMPAPPVEAAVKPVITPPPPTAKKKKSRKRAVSLPATQKVAVRRKRTTKKSR